LPIHAKPRKRDLYVTERTVASPVVKDHWPKAYHLPSTLADGGDRSKH
jgi:hypothetical protein